ncbi:hypothetical protein DM02DRAFT_500358, partial [Periconia macrospinosa]
STGLMAVAVLTPVFAMAILFFSLASIISYALFVAAVSFGFGRHSYYITHENRIKIKQLLLANILAGTCRPINANWEEVPKAQCFDSKVSLTISYAFAGFSIACDFIFAIMPILLIWTLTRSVVERCLISFLMAMSLFASVAGMLQLYLRMLDPTPSDPFRATVLV